MKKTFTLSLAALAVIGLMSFETLSSGGKSGKTTTGCGSCHGATATPAVTVSLAFTPAVTNGYIPGAAYAVVATVAQTGELLAGIDLAASAGTVAAGTNTKILNTEIVHTGSLNTTTTGTVAFDFTWTAPTSGAVTFNYAGLAADDNGGASGDFWQIGTQVVPLDATIGVEELSSINLNVSVFPNPVTESATISYVLAENSTVSANLVNVKGQVVSNLMDNEKQAAGLQNRNLTINSSIAKGIYFVAINVNGKSNYKKIVVE